MFRPVLNDAQKKIVCIVLFVSGDLLFLAPDIIFSHWCYDTFQILEVYKENVGYMQSQLWVGILSGVILYISFSVFWFCICNILLSIMIKNS